MTFTAPVWDMSAIMDETRAITGRPDTSMLSNQQLADFINYYYQYVLPKELKIFFGYTYYQFFTQPNIAEYTPPTTYQTLNPSIWFDGWPATWYLSPDLFYQDYPQQMNKVQVGTGDGATTTFTFTIPAYPVIPGSVYVTDGTQTAEDNGLGGFTAPASGSISYTTGAVSVTFATAPASNVNITCTSETYTPNRPQALLYYDNTFVVRPVPDNVYLCKMEGIKIPTALTELADIPFRPDLGPLIALGASIQIFKRFNQMDQIDTIMPEYMRYKDICMQDTYEEYLYQRSVPAF